MIYIFRHNNSDKRIIIFALSYLEAIDVLYYLNAYLNKTYNIMEYKQYDINIKNYQEALHIEDEYLLLPRIISEKEYNILCNYDKKIFNDKGYKDLHNTKVLTTKYFNNNTLMRTNEFINKIYLQITEKLKASPF